MAPDGDAEPAAGGVRGRERQRRITRIPSTSGLCGDYAPAHRRDYDLLLVWSLDRLSRGGVVALAGILERLKTAGVGIKSMRESWLDTSSPMVAELLIAIFGWLARQERDQLIARTPGRHGASEAQRRPPRAPTGH